MTEITAFWPYYVCGVGLLSALGLLAFLMVAKDADAAELDDLRNRTERDR